MSGLRFIVFGAPGSGKSTLLRHLPRINPCSIFDLKQIGGPENFELPESQRTELLKRQSFLAELCRIDVGVPLFVGCADVHPDTFPCDWHVIFLHHKDRAGYMQWVDKRNAIHPENKGQNHGFLYDEITKRRNRNLHSYEFDRSEFEGQPDALAVSVWKTIAEIL